MASILWTDRDKISNLYRRPSIDASYQVSVHLTKQFQRSFQKSTNQKQELSLVAIFVNESGRNEQSLQRTFKGSCLPNFSSFGKAVSVETIFQKSTNQKQELPVMAMFVNGSEQNEHSLQRIFQGCFLPSFGSFGHAVSDEKI